MEDECRIRKKKRENGMNTADEVQVKKQKQTRVRSTIRQATQRTRGYMSCHRINKEQKTQNNTKHNITEV